MAGYLQSEELLDGTSDPSPNVIDSYTYYGRSIGSGLTLQTIYPVASETAYSQNGGAGAEVTSYAYRSWYAGTLQPQEVWTTLPTIGTDQNGPGGTGATVYDYLDCSGNLTWEKDERGFITNYQYNWIPGMVLETVQDIDQGTATSLGLSAPWALPATGQDATTDYLYDPGRRYPNPRPGAHGRGPERPHRDLVRVPGHYPPALVGLGLRHRARIGRRVRCSTPCRSRCTTPTAT